MDFLAQVSEFAGVDSTAQLMCVIGGGIDHRSSANRSSRGRLNPQRSGARCAVHRRDP